MFALAQVDGFAVIIYTKQSSFPDAQNRGGDNGLLCVIVNTLLFMSTSLGCMLVKEKNVTSNTNLILTASVVEQ